MDFQSPSWTPKAAPEISSKKLLPGPASPGADRILLRWSCMSWADSSLPFLSLIQEQETPELSAWEGPPESTRGFILNKLGEWYVSCCPLQLVFPSSDLGPGSVPGPSDHLVSSKSQSCRWAFTSLEESSSLVLRPNTLREAAPVCPGPWAGRHRKESYSGALDAHFDQRLHPTVHNGHRLTRSELLSKRPSWLERRQVSENCPFSSQR